MGNWTLVIQGHGINGNATDNDADELAKLFLSTLVSRGQHDIKGAFVYGASLLDEGVIDATVRAQAVQREKLGFGKATGDVRAPRSVSSGCQGMIQMLAGGEVCPECGESARGAYSPPSSRPARGVRCMQCGAS